MATMDKALLDLLVCPESKAPLVLVGDWLYSTDRTTRRKYPVRDNIPVMLADQAETVSAEELERALAHVDK